MASGTWIREQHLTSLRMQDPRTRNVLLRCDKTGDLYPVLPLSKYNFAFLSSSLDTWHQRLGHTREDILRVLRNNGFISFNKNNSISLCKACQLGKHVKLPFFSSSSIVEKPFDIVHSDL